MGILSAAGLHFFLLKMSFWITLALVLLQSSSNSGNPLLRVLFFLFLSVSYALAQMSTHTAPIHSMLSFPVYPRPSRFYYLFVWRLVRLYEVNPDVCELNFWWLLSLLRQRLTEHTYSKWPRLHNALEISLFDSTTPRILTQKNFCVQPKMLLRWAVHSVSLGTLFWNVFANGEDDCCWVECATLLDNDMERYAFIIL
jgi:hypothetical protein